jgi:hypothetical protein
MSGDHNVIYPSVVIFLLPFIVEVNSRPVGYHVCYSVNGWLGEVIFVLGRWRG